MQQPINHQRPSQSFLFFLSLSTFLFYLQIPSVTAIPTPNPYPQLPVGAQIQEDTGQVTINGDPSGIENSPSIPNLPITATIFSGVPGPRSCRGHIIFDLSIPPPSLPNTSDARSYSYNPERNEKNSRIPKCYNLPSPAGCGNFVANKEDGCEIRLFAEPYCRLYMNTAVFVPERRSVGGNWRSVEVRCGVQPPDSESLGRPPLQDFMTQKGMGMGHETRG
ncbi:hypothetical protein V8F20_004814 [Naviculisporaceae sp. PSN 640]